MINLRFVCLERIKEIRRLRDLISSIEPDDFKILPNGGKATKQKTQRTLYSSFVVMHYSLLEAVMCIGLEELIETARRQCGSDDIYTEQFRKFIIHAQLKDLRDKDFSVWPMAVHELIVNFENGFDDPILTEKQARSLWPGNLDGKKVREQVFEKLGLALKVGVRERNGFDLVKIKDDRNDLAHGIRSWSEVGSDYSWPELCNVSRRVVFYILQVIKGFEEGVQNEFWKAETTTVPQTTA